jgi:tetratricopeptide (TPR) repeat protein
VADKVSRKELLKREDAFVKAAGQSALWVKSHRLLMMVGGVAAVLVIAAIFIVLHVSEAQNVRASELYFAALKLKDAPIAASPEAKPEGDDAQPSFPSEVERDKAVRAAFQKVIDEAGRSGVATMARLIVADYDEKLGDSDKALAGFLALADELSPTDSLYFIAVERAAYAKENKGDVDGALAIWQRLLGSEKRFYADHALFEMARLHANRGETDKARELLARIESEYKDSLLQDDVKQLYAVVGRPAKAAGAEAQAEPEPKAPENAAQ